MKKIVLLFLIFFYKTAFSQSENFKKEDISINKLINGTLYSPVNEVKDKRLVILIAGSGSTNRSGNQVGMQNNSLKYLSQDLASLGNFVFTYDKRIIAMMINKEMKESDLRFDDFINDAKDVIQYFKAKNNYSKIIIAGHSEGSLIGMVAANGNADGYISIAGAARPIDEVVTEQILAQMPNTKDKLADYFALLREGKTFKNELPLLESLFRESVQPYLISWIKYKPEDEIVKLKIPVLLINGTKDLQVKQSEAELLKKAKTEAQLVIIENMNHVFKEIKVDEDNLKSYSNPDLPVMKELVSSVNQFIKSL